MYLNRINTRYTLTNERLKIEKGLLSKSVDEIELFRVKDTKVKSTFLKTNQLVFNTNINKNTTFYYKNNNELIKSNILCSPSP